jgi:hypothetical protein
MYVAHTLISNKEAHNLASCVVLDDQGCQVWMLALSEGLSIPVSIEL